MMPDVALEIKHRLLALPSGKDQVLVGASEDEVCALEAYAGGRFPPVYRQFLKQLGRSAGELLRGSDYSISQRFQLRLREHAEELLPRNRTSFTLPKTAFVFLMTQGHQFAYFNLDDGDDPSVNVYSEGEPAPKRLDATISGYLLRCVEACEERERGVVVPRDTDQLIERNPSRLVSSE